MWRVTVARQPGHVGNDYVAVAFGETLQDALTRVKVFTLIATEKYGEERLLRGDYCRSDDEKHMFIAVEVDDSFGNPAVRALNALHYALLHTGAMAYPGDVAIDARYILRNAPDPFYWGRDAHGAGTWIASKEDGPPASADVVWKWEDDCFIRCAK